MVTVYCAKCCWYLLTYSFSKHRRVLSVGDVQIFMCAINIIIIHCGRYLADLIIIQKE